MICLFQRRGGVNNLITIYHVCIVILILISSLVNYNSYLQSIISLFYVRFISSTILNHYHTMWLVKQSAIVFEQIQVFPFNLTLLATIRVIFHILVKLNVVYLIPKCLFVSKFRLWSIIIHSVFVSFRQNYLHFFNSISSSWTLSK